MKIRQITEATFNVFDIVDQIYDKYFAAFIKDLNAYLDGDNDRPLPYLKSADFVMSDFYKVRDRAFREAVKKKDLSVRTGILSVGNAYYADIQQMALSFHDGLYRILENRGIKTRQELMDLVGPRQQRRLEKDLNGNFLKTSIAHEISHWLDDVHHGEQITKAVDKSKRLDKHVAQVFTNDFKKYSDVNFTPMEINAQVHAIKQAKRQSPGKLWDRMSLNDLYDHYGSLTATRDNSGDTVDFPSWKQALFGRLHREGLLGKKMR